MVLARIGPAAARRYFLTGERIDAATALRIGLVDEVAEDLDAAVERVVADILAGGPTAVREAKRLVLEPGDEEDLLARAAERRTSDEGQDGLRAFLEKRRPAGPRQPGLPVAPAGLTVPRVPIRKLLVANRGEIAVRIFRTCRELGIATVAVAAPDDAGALHTRVADETVAISSYLHSEEHIRAAKSVGADAIHPGYGFLSENGDFAEAVEAAGLVFVGPSPEALRAGGDKLAAKRVARETGGPSPRSARSCRARRARRPSRSSPPRPAACTAAGPASPRRRPRPGGPAPRWTSGARRRTMATSRSKLGMLDPVVEAAPLERVVHVAGAVRGEDDDRRALGA